MFLDHKIRNKHANKLKITVFIETIQVNKGLCRNKSLFFKMRWQFFPTVYSVRGAISSGKFSYRFENTPAHEKVGKLGIVKTKHGYFRDNSAA
jgi:hypothetical protein